jgi:hypothetical protein
VAFASVTLRTDEERERRCANKNHHIESNLEGVDVRDRTRVKHARNASTGAIRDRCLLLW